MCLLGKKEITLNLLPLRCSFDPQEEKTKIQKTERALAADMQRQALSVETASLCGDDGWKQQWQEVCRSSRVSHKTGLHSKQKHPHREEMNKTATATCRSLHQFKSDTAARVTREIMELLWVPLICDAQTIRRQGSSGGWALDALLALHKSSPKTSSFQVGMHKAECFKGSLCYPKSHIKVLWSSCR